MLLKVIPSAVVGLVLGFCFWVWSMSQGSTFGFAVFGMVSLSASGWAWGATKQYGMSGGPAVCLACLALVGALSLIFDPESTRSRATADLMMTLTWFTIGGSALLLLEVLGRRRSYERYLESQR